MSNRTAKRRMSRRRRRVLRRRRSMVVISMILILLLGIVAVRGVSLRERQNKYAAQRVELEAQIAKEQDRSKEIDELEKRVKTDEYIEEVAREKLGLVYENEIIFRAED